MEIVATVVTCIVSAISATVVALINSNARSAKTEQKFADALEQIQREQNDIREQLGTMAETLSQFKDTSDKFDAKLMNAFKAVARDRISQGHRYFMQKKQITESSKQSMHLIYECYKNMGGNGYVTTEMNDIDNLPVIN